MKKLTEYINNDADLMSSSVTNNNYTSKYENVNEEQSTARELEQYINEHKINEELNYRIFLSRNYGI